MISKLFFQIGALKLILQILNKHRKRKDSLLFLIHWTILNIPPKSPLQMLPPGLLETFKLKESHIQKLSGLYMGLEKELGTAGAILAFTELLNELSAYSIKKRLEKP